MQIQAKIDRFRSTFYHECSSGMRKRGPRDQRPLPSKCSQKRLLEFKSYRVRRILERPQYMIAGLLTFCLLPPLKRCMGPSQSTLLQKSVYEAFQRFLKDSSSHWMIVLMTMVAIYAIFSTV